MDTLLANRLGRRYRSTGRDAVVPTREAQVEHLTAGRVIVRDEEGELALSSFRFVLLHAQAALGAKQPVRCSVSLDTEYELIPISVQILTAWENGEEAQELPGDVALHARWVTY